MFESQESENLSLNVADHDRRYGRVRVERCSDEVHERRWLGTDQPRRRLRPDHPVPRVRDVHGRRSRDGRRRGPEPEQLRDDGTVSTTEKAVSPVAPPLAEPEKIEEDDAVSTTEKGVSPMLPAAPDVDVAAAESL